MKTKSTFAKLMSLGVLVAGLTAYAASRAGAAAVKAAPATTAQTETPPTTDFAFGGINIGRGQTASIIVVCNPDPNARDQQPVEVEFMVHDWEGNLLASETKTLVPGHASSFDIGASRGISQGSELQPRVKVLAGPSDPTANSIIAILEVWDTQTGRALFALNNPIKSTHNYFAATGEGVVRFGQGN